MSMRGIVKNRLPLDAISALRLHVQHTRRTGQICQTVQGGAHGLDCCSTTMLLSCPPWMKRRKMGLQQLGGGQMRTQRRMKALGKRVWGMRPAADQLDLVAEVRVRLCVCVCVCWGGELDCRCIAMCACYVFCTTH